LIRIVKLAAIVTAIAVLFAVVTIWQMQRRYVAPGPLTEQATVVIPKGARLEDAARRLEEAGVIYNKWVLVLGAKLQGARIKAGEYLFQPTISSEDVVAQLVEGHTVVHKLTIPEGLTVRRILDLIRDADYLAGDIKRRPEEGMILPETLFLSRDDSRDEVVGRLQHSMEQTLDRLWANRASDLPLSDKHQALVLASIVERETGIAAERPHVAAVFENRLKLGMRLQSDPTVIYGISDGMGILSRPVTHDDLSVRHAWNTYVIDGLPPTAIAAPGKAAIEAVLHPLASQDLYFVANGGGGHAFAKSLSEHNVNVTRLRHMETNDREEE
jgi:UPF0755 protein